MKTLRYSFQPAGLLVNFGYIEYLHQIRVKRYKPHVQGKIKGKRNHTGLSGVELKVKDWAG